MLVSIAGGTVSIIGVCESFDATKWREVGLVHDLSSWIALYLAVMHKEKQRDHSHSTSAKRSNRTAATALLTQREATGPQPQRLGHKEK